MRMLSPRLPLVLLALVASAAAPIGCAAGVAKRAASNPFSSGVTAKLLPLSFKGLMMEQIMTEEVYLGRNAARPEMRSWAQDKEAMAANFKIAVERLAPNLLGEGPLLIQVRAANIFPGGDMDSRSSLGVRNNTRGTYVLYLLNEKQEVLDQLEFEAGVVASPTNLFASQRLREMGTLLGEQVADYLNKRAAGN